jgi:hypothetical protein
MAIENSNRIIFRETPINDEYRYTDYYKILELTSAPNEIVLADTLGGFDPVLQNRYLAHLNSITDQTCTVWLNQITPDQVQQHYPKLDFRMDFPLWLWNPLSTYNMHPEVAFKNFICSFNGAEHVSRKLLVAILERFGYFDPDYSTKNFVYDNDAINGHVRDFVGEQENFYGKFFQHTAEFGQQIHTINYSRFDHNSNIHALEQRLTQSFVNIISESLATSYMPFVSEKFLYSVVTRGLFVAYAQPGWHEQLENCYGFRKYDKIFDYAFDQVSNPIKRLLDLVTMLSKFSCLSTADWHDLYLIELDTIEHNYDHYFSGRYLEQLKRLHD